MLILQLFLNFHFLLYFALFHYILFLFLKTKKGGATTYISHITTMNVASDTEIIHLV